MVRGRQFGVTSAPDTPTEERFLDEAIKATIRQVARIATKPSQTVPNLTLRFATTQIVGVTTHWGPVRSFGYRSLLRRSDLHGSHLAARRTGGPSPERRYSCYGSVTIAAATMKSRSSHGTVWPSRIHWPEARRSYEGAVQPAGSLEVDASFDGGVEVEFGVAFETPGSGAVPGPSSRVRGGGRGGPRRTAR